MSKLLCCLFFTLFLVDGLFGQSPYFIRSYPNYPGKTISQSFFHPDGGLTTLFTRVSGADENLIFRMDSSGTILQSYSTLGDQYWPIEVEVADNGNHWVLHERPAGTLPGDSVYITHLDANLNLLWRSGFTLPLGAGEEVRGGSIVQDGNGLLFVGYVSSNNNPYWNGLWVARIDANGNMTWSQRYPTNIGNLVMPEEITILSNGNIVVTGYQLDFNGPPYVGFLIQFNSAGTFLSEHWAGLQSHDFGNVLEQPNGDLVFLAGFDYTDWIYQFTHTNLHILPAGSTQINSTKFIEDWKGEDCFMAGGILYGLVDGYDGLQLYGGGVSLPIFVPNNPMNEFHNSSFGFKDQQDRKQSMDHVLTPQGADVLIGLGRSVNPVVPVLTRTNLSGAGIVALEEGLVAEPTFSIGPNPSAGQLMLSLGHEGEAIFNVYNSSGKLCLAGHATHKQVIDLERFPAGAYFIEVYAGEDRRPLGTRKLVLSK